MWLPVVYNEVRASRPAVQLSMGRFIFHRCVPSVWRQHSQKLFPLLFHFLHTCRALDIWFLMHQPTDQFKQFCNISSCTEVLLYFISQKASF